MAIDSELLETIHRIIDSRIEPFRVHREEHEDLKAAVHRLEESHARVEDELARLAAAQRETQESLLRFQRSTEERLNALTEAQARTEQRLEQLAQAQARTEERLEQLAQAQARTEERLEQLAQAQTELTEAVRDTRREVGGLSQRLGSDLEEIGRIVVAEFLRHEEGIELASLEGRYLRVDGHEIEVDLFGEGRRGGESVVVIGECKARVFPRELETFYRRTEGLLRSLGKPAIRVVYCQRVHPDAEQFARQTGIIFVPWSYQHRIWAQDV